jgi:hypothetical protein
MFVCYTYVDEKERDLMERQHYRLSYSRRNFMCMFHLAMHEPAICSMLVMHACMRTLALIHACATYECMCATKHRMLHYAE